MIAWLQGTVVVKQGNMLIVAVNGIGYELTVPLSVIEQTDQGRTLELFVHQTVREDGHYLFGFSSLSQRQLFRELIRVSGIGPKLAILILSGLDSEELVQAIGTQNSAALIKLPGIGRKTAERLIVELGDRIGKYFPDCNSGDRQASSSSRIGGTAQEAEQALVALELKPSEAARLVAAAARSLPSDADSATLIKAAFAQKLKREAR